MIFLKNEIEFLTKKLFPKVKANYYLWSYMNWLFVYLFELNHQEKYDIYLKYLNEFKTLLYLSPSDYCVYHTRLHLIGLLHQMPEVKSAFGEIILSELELIDDLLIRYPYYMTTWNYCKYFLLFIKTNTTQTHIDTSNLNEYFNKSIETLFFKFDVKNFLLKNSTRNFNERLIEVAKCVKLLYKLDRNEHILEIERFSEQFLKFLNKFIF